MDIIDLDLSIPMIEDQPEINDFLPSGQGHTELTDAGMSSIGTCNDALPGVLSPLVALLYSTKIIK